MTQGASGAARGAPRFNEAEVARFVFDWRQRERESPGQGQRFEGRWLTRLDADGWSADGTRG